MSTTQEEMAMAVLRGDKVAARALADSLLEDERLTTMVVAPITKVTVNRNQLRAVFYVQEGVTANEEGVQQIRDAFRGWLSSQSDNPLILVGIDRMELYELKETTDE